jgi:hypothetical protein
MGGWVSQSGTPGIDHSANGPGLPGSTLLFTIPANKQRNNVGMQNQSTSVLSVCRDDGTGANLTVLILSAASAAGAQGADWSSQTFKGRLRVYGVAGSQVAAYED